MFGSGISARRAGLLTRASVALDLYREVYQHPSCDLRDEVELIIGVAGRYGALVDASRSRVFDRQEFCS